MTDVDRATPRIDTKGRFIHWCGHPGCRAWGCFGAGVHLDRYRAAVQAKDPHAHRFLGRWRCGAHRADLQSADMRSADLRSAGTQSAGSRPARPGV